MKSSTPPPGKIWQINGAGPGGVATIKEIDAPNGVFPIGEPTFQSEFRQQILNGKSASEALNLVIGKSPELYKDWLEAGAGPLDLNPQPVLVKLATFKEAVDYYVAQGKKPGKAIDLVLARHPGLYES